MPSWIYLFSKFTPEALLFEALIILLLTATYTGFWVLHKRRVGVVRNEVPAGLVKGYLNELITDAERLRAQLFGMLAAAGIPMGTGAATYAAAPQQFTSSPGVPASSGDPDLARKLAALEARMVEQAKAMEAILADKARLEKELAEARAKGGVVAASPEVPKLQEKIQTLEGKLAEYSVIEDDLANLKRLQQENVQLRATLQGKGLTAPPAPAASAAAPSPAAPSPAAPPPASAPQAESSPRGEAGFEGLVDQVEASLAEATESPQIPASEEPSADPLAAMGGIGENTETIPTEASPETAVASTSSSPGKSDEDLVAEFEKMLNS